TLEDVRRAFEFARAYRPALTRYERAAILRRAADAVRARTEEIAAVITAEAGLCKKDSIYEAGRVADVLVFGAGEVLKDDGQIFSCDLTPHGKKRRVYTQRDPLLGVISAITPFNHPMNQVAHKIVPSIATNNRIVVKPSEKVPLSCYLLADILYDAGLPVQMLQVLTGDPGVIADELITNPAVDLITFTGGVSIGKSIASRMGYRRAVLELGGNDPIIVMEDADLDEASSLAVSGSYKNSGQRCTAIKRMLVHEAVADRFTDLVVEKTLAWKYGNPADSSVDMGTVIDEAAAQFCERQVNDALSRGARLLAGNVRDGALYSPTVVDRVTPDMPLVKYETFGPVSPIMRFANIDEAIRMSNCTDYALSSSVCTNRFDYITRFITELEVGSVNVREVPGYRLELTPFGGVKDSGLGYKEGVQEAMKSFTNTKTYSLPW
ncbi:phosphonoacetaldehyde dehydrogenase, partial [Paraburkholderia sp.]|uniref:phosphonoacetaldehyde dehydrogenase n=1 Tax=Paraburkholderia sp. TaxID=1926495 RepID=UPI002D437168